MGGKLIENIGGVLEKCTKKPYQFNWVPGLFIIIYHLALLIGLPFYFAFCTVSSWPLIVSSFALMYAAGLSITMGYHRLYSHMAYKASPILEVILVLFGTLATQGSVIRWSFDHRHHHAFVDTDRDPYSIKKGFWYAHFFWLFEKPKKIESSVVADLERKPLLRFQHRYYGILFVVTNVLAYLFFASVFQDYLGALVFTILLRIFFLHHFTWFINSLAHTWGARTFCKELSAVDNYIIALLTFGEGYHNYHHTFAQDYRNGIRWFHFDPTKWLIWLSAKCGLARQLRTVQQYQIEEKILLERKRLLLDKLGESFYIQREEWEKKITAVIDNVLVKWKQVRKLQESYTSLKKEGAKELLSSLKLEIKALKKSLEEEYQNWTAVSAEIASLSQ